MLDDQEIIVIGGGLAGVEAARQISRRGRRAVLYEMRPERMTPAHKTGGLAELVCSNSMRSDEADSAVGMLHSEMRRLGSLVIEAAEVCRVPAGSALAVDRERFSQYIERKIECDPLITVIREEIKEIPRDREVIVATGPLTDGAMMEELTRITGEECVRYFDAISPIVEASTIDMEIAWHQSRWDKTGEGDYVNCPMDCAEYCAFVDVLLKGRKVDFKQWEIDDPRQVKYFEGCLPIEVMAERGRDTLAFGPLKPAGLMDPRTGRRPFAVAQLRRENLSGTLLNMVGFQTKLAYGDQVRAFRMIPGLERARFARFGGLHRNSFINAPRVLDGRLCLKAMPNVKVAGQLAGCEGYVESAAVGLIAGLDPLEMPPATTAVGAVVAHLTANANPDDFQPMNVNFGLFEPVEVSQGARKSEKKNALLERAAKDFKTFISAFRQGPQPADREE